MWTCDTFRDQIIKKSPKLADKLGLLGAKYLGSGAFGEAYLTKSGRVVKLSTDPLEAKAAYKLVGKRLKYVVNIHAVYKLDVPGVDCSYAIIQARLHPLTSKEVDIGWDLIDLASADIRATDFRQVLNVPETPLPQHNRRRRLGASMYKMRLTLEKQGVYWDDMHPYNIMKDRAGNYKAIDLRGKTQGVAVKDIPTLRR